MSTTGRVIDRILTLTGSERVYTYPGSPPRYVYEAVEEHGKDIVSTVREQHLLHLAQSQYFRTLEEGKKQIPIVVASADLGEAMLSQPLLAGSITCPCIVVVAEEQFPHVGNAVNTAHQSPRATTYETISQTEALQQHEGIAERLLVSDESDIDRVDQLVETVAETKDVGFVHLPLYTEADLGSQFEFLESYSPTVVSQSAFTSRVSDADRPLLIVGRGIRHPETRQRVSAIAADAGIPIATTLQTDGYFDTSHVGRIGTLGTPSANEAFFRSDLVIALGTSVNNLVTSYDPETIKEFQAKTIQVEDNPRRRSVFTDSWFSSGVETALDVLDDQASDVWFDCRYDCGSKYELVPDQLQALGSAIRVQSPESVVTLGVGNSMLWMTYALGPTVRKEVSRSGSMGEVVSGLEWGESPILVLGDGEFEMDLSLITEAQYQESNPIICVVNNSRLGLVTERQEAEFGQRITPKDPSPIKYDELGRCFDGVESYSTETPEEVKAAFETATSRDVTAIIEIGVSEYLSDDLYDITSLPRIQS
ncbi:thiamine pyrophosphate-dependent enzyme [Natrarchaeobius chitinivorans]|uniref:Thiamine pyrophosphate-binding protein n=1 Tax=Natrarchaeobius chitinivorans TaxID=1679083 RepID=A0A3N6LN40_NATCH|nr:thiamine pyrophosphate-dependent enzyme [Natrarchaeobius chitinivorans]RQG89357.1 thiamine pyrophosphate-binding protein [Natrarchaeobius chitinivorans]